MKLNPWTRFLLGASLLTVATLSANAQFVVNFEKPQTPANYPALFYDSDQKPVAIDKNTGGITVTFSGGELLTDPKGLLFPGTNTGGNANKTTFYASQFPPAYGTSNTITITFSKPVNTVSLELMNNAGGDRTFTFKVNGQDGGELAFKDASNSYVTPPKGPRRGITSITVYSSPGEFIVPAWRFGVDNIEYVLPPGDLSGDPADDPADDLNSDSAGDQSSDPSS